MRVDLTGLFALVAGVESELGRAMAERLAENGASVVTEIPGRLDILVNVEGASSLTRAAATVMTAQQSGRIINVVSATGLVPLRSLPMESAAAADVISRTRSLAMELAAHGILVNAVAAGTYDPAADARLLAHIPLGRPATPREIANAVLFLAAPENAYMTGHVLTVDGGWSVGYARDF